MCGPHLSPNAQLHQIDTRCTGAPDYIDAGITILQQRAPGEKPTLVACTGLEVDRQVQLEVGRLPRCLPFSLGRFGAPGTVFGVCLE